MKGNEQLFPILFLTGFLLGLLLDFHVFARMDFPLISSFAGRVNGGLAVFYSIMIYGFSWGCLSLIFL